MIRDSSRELETFEDEDFPIVGCLVYGRAKTRHGVNTSLYRAKQWRVHWSHTYGPLVSKITHHTDTMFWLAPGHP